MSKLAVFDCDDVLADLRTIVLQRLSLLLERNVELHELTHWNLSEAFGSQIDAVDLFSNISLESIPVELQAAPFLMHLKTEGYRLEIVTARGYHPNAVQRTLNWCHSHSLPIDKVHVVPLYGDKKQVLEQMGQIHFYVEDNHDHVIAADQLPNVERIFLMDRPWNRSCDVGTRVQNLMDVYRVLF